MSSPIPVIYKSIIRSITKFIDDVNAADLLTDEASYHNWEARNDENDLPRNTLIGTDGFAFDENDGRWIIRFALAISAHADSNLLHEVELLGMVHDRFGKDKKIPLVDLSTAEEVNELVVAQFQVAPMGQSEIRNYRTISLELHRTGTNYT